MKLGIYHVVQLLTQTNHVFQTNLSQNRGYSGFKRKGCNLKKYRKIYTQCQIKTNNRNQYDNFLCHSFFGGFHIPFYS